MKARLDTQGSRYIAVGSVTAFVEYVVFMIIMLVVLDSSVKLNIAQTISFVVAMIVNFYGNRSVTFGGNNAKFTHSRKKQAARYLVLAIANLMLSNVIINVLVVIIGLPALVAKLFTMIVIVAWTYLVFQNVIFKKITPDDK